MGKTASPSHCPNRAELEALLAGDLSGESQAAVSAHMEFCPPCRELLEAVAVDGESALSDVVLGLDAARPKKESAFWPALQNLEQLGSERKSEPSEKRKNPSGEAARSYREKFGETGIPDRLGSFEIRGTLGRGGMGVVLRAFDPSLSREVAVKLLDPQLADNSTARQRFCREARAAASVSHENIVAIHQVHEDEAIGLPYLVMQLVGGESLEQRLKRVGAVSVAETVRIGIQAASALAAAHAVGLIHRDVKPGNIMIDGSRGTVELAAEGAANVEVTQEYSTSRLTAAEVPIEKILLTDFGLARTTEDDNRLTRTGFVAGTPLYMAPEQARGDEYDHRADLFSLGTVLFESLTGKPPFEGKSPLAVLRSVADNPHPKIRDENKDVPAWLEQVIDKLLAKNPEDRFSTAEEVRDILVRHQSDLGPSAKPVHKKCPPMAAMHKKGICWITAMMVAGTFFVGVVVGSSGLWLMHDRPLPVPLSALAEDVGAPPKYQLPTQSGTVWSLAMTHDKRRLVVGLENGQLGLWDLEAKRLLFDLHPKDDEEAMAHRGAVWSASLTDDDKFLVSSSDDGIIRRWDLDARKEMKSLNVGSAVRCAAVGSSGNLVAIGDRRGTVRLFNLLDEACLATYDQRATVNGVAFTPDETTLASVGTDGSIQVRDLGKRNGEDRLRRNLRNAHDGPIYGVAISHDGKRLATASWDKTVRIWDLQTLAQLKRIEHKDGVWSVAFSPCGHFLAAAGQDGKVHLWNGDDGTELLALGDGKTVIHSVKFSQDGHTVVAGARDGGVRVWDVSDCVKKGGSH